MIKFYLYSFLFLSCSIFAQEIDSLFAVSIKSVPNANGFNTNSILKIAKFKPTTGIINTLGAGVNNAAGQVSLTGGSINQTNNTFNLVGNTIFRAFDLTTGNLIQQTAINNFAATGITYFDHVRFNNSNTSLYGLARLFEGNQFQGMYLSKLNTVTGNLIQLSQISVGNQVAIRGTVIDPIQMIYYYSDGPKFVGLDLFNGSIYSNPNYVFSNPEYFGFTNIAFNCATNEIFGLVQGRTPGVNPLFPVNFIYYNRLAKINPTTGVVTEISSVNLPSHIFSLNASSTIDESNGIYYFAAPQTIYGVSLTTGLVVSTAPITFQDGGVLNFMNNFNNCIGITALRQDPALSNEIFLAEKVISIYPNPVETSLNISTALSIDKIEIYDSNGRRIKTTSGQKEINVSQFAAGMYFLKIYGEKQIINQKFIKI